MDKEKMIKYAKKFWWVILLIVLAIIGNLLPEEDRTSQNLLQEYVSVNDNIASVMSIEELNSEFDKAVLLRDKMKSHNDTSVRYNQAIVSLDTTITYRDEIVKMRTHKIKMEKLFGYKGNCRPLSKVIKESMHNPESYEHVETVRKYLGDDKFYVIEKCRGTNAYGGVITVNYEATVNLDGEILNIKQL